MPNLRTILLGMGAVTAIAGTALAQSTSTDGTQDQTIMDYGTGARTNTGATGMTTDSTVTMPSFTTLDTNSSNSISQNEFTNNTARDVALFDRLDTNDDDMLSATELNAYETASGTADNEIDTMGK